MKDKNMRAARETGTHLVIFCIGIVFMGMLVWGIFCLAKQLGFSSPEERLITYMSYIPKKEYDKMYDMLDVEASGKIKREEFIKRNSAIYEGIEIKNLSVKITSYEKKTRKVFYDTTFDTCAGPIRFSNAAEFKKGKEGYLLVWDDSLIFPDLLPSDKVRVSATEAKRGTIYDRNGTILAGEGFAITVGIVPGKLKEKETAIPQIASFLEMDASSVEKKLSAQWVKEDSFVPIKMIPKVSEREVMSLEPDEKVKKEKERQEKLLEIPGVMLSETKVRTYPLGEAASHLIGYVQTVTKEDLEEHAGEGYTQNSVIGRSGLESLFEKELKGENGCRIFLVDEEGQEKTELASVPVKNGKDVKLTIDAGLQTSLYQAFQKDKSCSVAMNPDTGEVLALLSTPSYDNNAFILGLSEEQWKGLNEDEEKPLYNRFRQIWCPGSSFKPVVGAIGLESGAIDPAENEKGEGLHWQKDSSWGSYYVTTLHTYEPVNLENALIYSDNIYFAKAALKIGAGEMEQSLQALGFGEAFPFDIRMEQSRYSNSDHIETEIQLADSGYGQGQILVNPLHLASIYSAFCNQGNMRKPSLLPEEKEETIWKTACSAETAETVKEALVKVVNDPNGTGYGAHREDVILAGKTGTAEIKASKEDTSGTELGWFAVFTAEEEENPVLLVSMVEDVKERGGSGYVVQKDSKVLKDWFGRNDGSSDVSID